MREHRKYDRATAVIKVNYSTHGDLKMDYAQNISRGGLFLATENHFELGQGIELHLNTSGLKNAIAVPGVVRWVGERGTPAVKGIGVQFKLDDPKAKERIDRMVNVVDEPIKKQLAETLEAESIQIFILDPNDFASKMYADGIYKMARRGEGDLSGPVEVSRFTTPKDLETTLEDRPCSALIIELKSTEFEGVAVIKKLREQFGESLPIFAISRPFPRDRYEALEAGATAFLNKPLQMRTLFNTLLICLQEG
ncbi:MAG: hypothetical protein CMH49_02715 [Myxococcales bacterium]|nr:hypothetical protein [Myxococcales bacterium]